jgi:hypothetical protein
VVSKDLAKINRALRRDAVVLGLGFPGILVVGSAGVFWGLWETTHMSLASCGVLAFGVGLLLAASFAGLYRRGWMHPQRVRRTSGLALGDAPAELVYLRAALAWQDETRRTAPDKGPRDGAAHGLAPD